MRVGRRHASRPNDKRSLTFMPTNGQTPLSPLRWLERTGVSLPGLERLDAEICAALTGLSLPQEKLHGRRIAVSVGSRGIANLREIARAICVWLRQQGAEP